MDFKERIWSALNLEIPDRVPVHTVALDGTAVNEILGNPSKTAFDIINRMEKSFGNEWVFSFNEIMAEFQSSIFGRMMEAAANLGFDACMTGYIPFKIQSKQIMTDVYGRRYKIINNKGNIFPSYETGLINNREDWKNWPDFDKKKMLKNAKKVWRSVKNRHHDKIYIFAADDYTSIFPPVWQGMGMKSFVRALKRDPELIQERINMTTEIVIDLFKLYFDNGARVFFEGGDIAYKTGLLIHPKYIKKYLEPAYKTLTSAVHSWGDTKIIFHSDGDIQPLLTDIVNWGFDGLHCLEPSANVDPAYVKNKVGSKLCLLGNIDTMHILTSKGSQLEVENAVKNVIKAAGRNGGFILSPSNDHPLVSVQNLKWMINAAKKFGVYEPKSSEIQEMII